jgi:DNA polymerase III delta prime subunit
VARMVPFPMLPTRSSAERRLYEAFLSQLADEYVVYHSPDWILAPQRPGDPPLQGEADFLIAHPVDGLLAVEVKGGDVEYHPDTKRWTQAGRGGKHQLDEDPFHQARAEMYSLIEILKHQPGWGRRWMPSYGFAVAFPDGNYREAAHPGAPVEVVIDHDDLERVAERVKEIQRYWRRPGRKFGAEGMEALERALGRRVEIRLPLGIRFGEEDRKVIELTNEQTYVLSYVSHLRRAAIVGPAGSGKTMLALQLARKLAASGKRTLLTCFNWRLAEHLRASTRGTESLDVFHFHELCREVARKAGLEVPPAPEDGGPNDRYFEERLPGLLEDAAVVLGPQYDAMVVDEAQDFREAWWPRLLTLHSDPEKGSLFLFSDDNQNIYRGEVPGALVDLTIPLPGNLRNAKPIHEFVSVFYRGETTPLGRGPDGRPIEILEYRDEDQEARLLSLVLRNLEEERVPLEDVVVLTPMGAAKSRLWKRGRADGYRLSDDPKPGEVQICSIHGFKGLERPVVILAELGERHTEDLGPYLYVGGSRARNHLIVLATEPVAKELRQLTGVTGTA